MGGTSAQEQFRGRMLAWTALKQAQRPSATERGQPSSFLRKTKSREEAEKSASDMLTCGFFWLVEFESW